MKKICEICGEEFTAPHSNTMMCPNCRQFALEEIRQMKERKKRREQLQKEAKGAHDRIVKDNQLAWEFGISYGKFMAAKGEKR